nr:hypothetical protein [Escherichia coli]
MLENSEGLAGKLVLRHRMEVMEGRLSGPADGQAAVDVGLRPLEDHPQLGPVADLFERQALDRSACDDEAVEALGADALRDKDIIKNREIHYLIGINLLHAYKLSIK